MTDTKVPIELSSTPGIIDNSTATAITIDSAGAATFSGTVTADGLTVDGNNSYTSNIKFDYGASAPTYFANWGYKSSSDGNNVFLTITDGGSAKDVLVASYNGKVGIGTTPATLLDIKEGTAATDAIIGLTAGTGGRAQIRSEAQADNSSSELSFHTMSGFSTAEAMRISGGNVGIGTTVGLSSPSAATVLRIGNQINLYEYDDSSNPVQLNLNQNIDANENYITTDQAARYQMRDGAHSWFSVASGTAGTATSIGAGQKMTLDASGNLLVGGTSVGASDSCAIESYGGITIARASGVGRIQMTFKNGGTTVGTISTTTSNTTYATSSDYRLKEDDVPMTGATERVKALRPINFAWKVDGSRTDGFFAHEAQEVVPEAATGSKDAMRDEEYEVTPAVEEVRDEDGNVTTEAVAAVMGTRSVPDYQGIDQSKLVPLLTATIQELIARIEALEGA